MQVSPSFVRDTSKGGQDKAAVAPPEVPAVESGLVVDWDAYESILDNILYAKASFKDTRLGMDRVCGFDSGDVIPLAWDLFLVLASFRQYHPVVGNFKGR